MAGKAYTMQEMRDIVAYLVEKGAYSETRARSMWQEFANCGRTRRTWQSLKETFLKRILPDIHNPYYRLTENQITSFRAGTDISKMSGNRLEIREVGESSRSKNENTNKVAPEKPTLSEDKGENFVINHKNGAPSVRSSTETVVLDSAEDFAVAEEVILALAEEEKLKRELESPNKSLKDMIIFQDPLTPMMQSLVGDSDGSNFSDSDNRLSMENETDAVTATTSTADTFLPNNQEGNNVISGTTHNSNENDVTNGPKTRSQANEQSTLGPRSVLKNNKKGEDLQEPAKKKVRLNDTVASDGGVGTSRNENGTTVDKISHKSSRGHNKKRLKGKKGQSIKASVGEISSVEELMAILTDSVLPNNQEGIKALKKFLEIQGDKGEKSDILSEDKTTSDNKTNNTEDTSVMQVDSYSKSSETAKDLDPEKNVTTRKAKQMKEIAVTENIASETIDIDSDGEESNQDEKVTRNTQNKNDVKTLDVHKVDSGSINSSEITKLNKAPESSEDEPDIRTTRAKKKNAEDNVKNTISIQSTDTLSALEDNIRARSPSPIICLKDKRITTPIKLVDQQKKVIKESNDNLTSNAKKPMAPSQEPEPPKPTPQEDVAPREGESDREQKSRKPEITETHNVDGDDSNLLIVSPENSEPLKILTEVHQVELIKSQDIEKNSAKPDRESFEKQAKDTEDDVTSDKSVKNNINKVTEKVITEHQEETSETRVREEEIINNNVVTPENTNFYTALDNASDLPCANPCLQNATAEENQKENQLKAVHAKKKGRTVVLLPSHSDSDSDSSLEAARRPKRSMGARGANVLSRIFGLCDGNIRNRRLSHKSRNSARDRYRSETSESSSEEQGDEDLIPIPRPGRKVRYMRRPVEGRVEALPEGALVAVYNGQIYRIVAQRGRRVYNVSYSSPGERKQSEPPRCDADLESSNWLNDGGPAASTSAAPASYAAPASPAAPESTVAAKKSEERIVPEAVAPNPPAAPSSDQASVILTKDKITFSGNADKIISMLPHFPSVMKGLFGGAICAEVRAPETEERPEPKDENKLNDDEIRERVKAREAEIFREIEERDAAARDAEAPNAEAPNAEARLAKPPNGEARNAASNEASRRSSEEKQPKTEEPQQRPKSTRRKRPPRKNSSPSPAGATEPSSRGDDDAERASESDHEIIIQEEGRKRGAQGEAGPEGRKRRNLRLKQDTEATADLTLDSDDEVRYSLPSQAAAAAPVAQRRPAHKPSKQRAKEYEESSEDILEESTQGYLDTDISFVEIRSKRRRKTHHLDFSHRRSFTLTRERTAKSYNGRPNLRRNSVVQTQLQVIRVLSSSDDNLQGDGEEQLSLSEKEIIPDSDETLHLTPIPESVCSGDVSLPGLDTVPDKDAGNSRLPASPETSIKNAGYSSNVSLPASPEISIVENISARSSSICQNDHCRTINEQLTTHQKKKHSKKVSILSDDVNFSCPLMEQDLAITSGVNSEQTSQIVSNRSSVEEMELCVTDLNEFSEKDDATSKIEGNGATVTESLLSKVIDININDTPFSESMQNGIINLRLNSESRSRFEDGKSPKVSAKGKSRCSTPNKKSKFRKSQPPLIGSVIEEESMQVECCSKKKRLSCPPVIDIDGSEKSPSNFKMPESQPAKVKKPLIVVTQADMNNVTVRKWKVRTPSKPKPKIIKVKILKPTSKNVESPKKRNKDEHSALRKSMPSKASKSKKSDEKKSRSGQSSTDSACSSAELIHNHSDTCLAARECMPRGSDSEANVSDSGVALQRHIFTPSPDCFSSEARDGNSYTETASLSSHSVPLNLSNLGSLLTEETDGRRSATSSWYLLSEEEEEEEEESLHRRLSHKEEDEVLLAKYGPHIASLYPRACAVPELSTITENSSDTRGSAVQHQMTPTCSVDGLNTFTV